MLKCCISLASRHLQLPIVAKRVYGFKKIKLKIYGGTSKLQKYLESCSFI